MILGVCNNTLLTHTVNIVSWVPQKPSILAPVISLSLSRVLSVVAL